MECPLCGREAEASVTCVELGWWVGEVTCTGHATGDCSLRMQRGGHTRDEALVSVIAAWNVRNDD